MTIEEIINSTKTIAIIGLSSSPYRTSHRIGKYILNEGFRVIPINPNEVSVFGLTCYSKMADLPKDTQIDMVVIFRKSYYTAGMVEEIIEWSNKTGQKPFIWTQIGVSSEEAKELAEETNFRYIEERCLMVEHSRIR